MSVTRPLNPGLRLSLPLGNDVELCRCFDHCTSLYVGGKLKLADSHPKSKGYILCLDNILRIMTKSVMSVAQPHWLITATYHIWTVKTITVKCGGFEEQKAGKVNAAAVSLWTDTKNTCPVVLIMSVCSFAVLCL